MRGWTCDGLVAGAVAGALSGVPSTVWTLARGGRLLESTEAAGTIVMPDRVPPALLLVSGAVTHAAISLGWGVVLRAVLPRRPSLTAGAAAGLAIAALDLGVVGRRIPRVRALEPLPQVLDHMAFGVVVAAVLRLRRRRAVA